MFSISYYLTVAHIFENNIIYYFELNGAHFSAISLILNFIVALLFGIYIALLIYKNEIVKSKKISEKAIGISGATIATLASGCSACGLPFLGFIGLPVIFSYLPFGGNELKILGILLLAISIHIVVKNIKNNLVCKINTNKKEDI